MSVVTDGFVLRRATHADVEGVVALNRAHNGADSEPPLRRLIVDPSIFTVVESEGRVVSTLCLLEDAWWMGGVEIPLGRPEFVVTDDGFRGRGLIRAQMDLVHRWSAERGDLAQMITGIPYFYRQFGYEYATMPDVVLHLCPGSVPEPRGWTVRKALPEDARVLAALSDRVGSSFGLTDRRDADRWHAFLASNDDRNLPLVALSPEGTIEGYGLVRPTEPPALVRIGCTTAAAVATLCREAMGSSGLRVVTQPGTVPARALEPVGSRRTANWGPVVRVPDPVALLRRLTPVLETRLRGSIFGSASGELYLSFHRSGARISYEDGSIVGVEATGRAERNPVEDGGVGVPPDLAATLIFGAYAASGLEERYRDVDLGSQRALMDVLFPKVRFTALLFE